MPQIPGFAFRVLGTAMAAYRFPRLRRADPHPLGLTAPPLQPVALGGETWDRDGLIDITLAYGDPLDISAPLVEVTTWLPGRIEQAAPEQQLARLAHNDAAVRRRDWLTFDEPASDPEGPVAFSDALIVIDGQPCPVSVLSYQHYQAARFVYASTVGTVASRHCPLDRLNLTAVPSIEPYLAGYSEFMRRMAHQR